MAELIVETSLGVDRHHVLMTLINRHKHARKTGNIHSDWDTQVLDFLPDHHAPAADQSRFMMMDELSHVHTRPPRCYKSHPPINRRTLSGPFVIPSVYGGQRRHASHASEGAAQALVDFPHHNPDRRPDWARKEFERVTRLPRSDFKLDHAWNIYQDAKEHLPPSSIVAFADKFISSAEMNYKLDTNDTQLQEWGRRGIEILDAMPSFTRTIDQWRLCLLARSLALCNDLENARATLHAADKVPLLDTLKAGIPYAYKMIIHSLARYRGNTHAIKFIGQEFRQLNNHFRFHNSDPYYQDVQRACLSLKRAAFQVVTEVVDFTPFLQREDWDKKRREAMGSFFIDALCFSQMPSEAQDVVLAMQKLGVHVALDDRLLIIRLLAERTSSLRLAAQMYAAIPAGDHTLPYLQAGLHVHARQGNTELAGQYFNDIAATCLPSPDDITALIRAHALAKDTQRASDVFNEHFPLDSFGKRQNSPSHSQYAAVIYAYSLKGDKAGMVNWLEDLASADLVPNVHIFTLVLNAVAHTGDFESAMSVLAQMRDAGIKPNVVAYTIIITLLAQRRDVYGAEALFKRAMKDGIVPDSRMINALMNAHAQAGSWRGVIRAYDYVAASQKNSLSLDVHNTLMKAYVLSGAPFSTVHKFFTRLESAKEKPDAYTYSLLMQSACDEGLMNIASDIYYDLEQLALENPHRNLDINVYILTILMAGFLRHGDKIRAKAVYDVMREKGIQPTPVTFSILLQAYGNERSAESLQVAEQFVQSLVAVPESERAWQKPNYAPVTALQSLYAPLVSAYTKMDKPEDAQRLLQELVDAGEEPSLGMLTAFLDLHRRNFDIDAVLDLWPKVYRMGMEVSKSAWLTEVPETHNTRNIRGNVLCIPLSIYIDALSAAGYHDEIATVWKDFRAQGFSFDSHNWNHLVVALVRAGQPERAFEVIERVIIPFQELSANADKPRDLIPFSPLLFDVNPVGDDNLIEVTPGDPPMQSRQRILMHKIAKSRTQRLDNWEAEEHNDDSVYHLHILQQISPSWATWRPHRASLTILLTALNHLNAGILIQPCMPDGHDVAANADVDERRECRDILNRIYANYPKTVKALFDFESQERERLGSDYDKEYIWG
ncbi:hypothetical protein DXG03_000191 [Asterophora parasitica]|uniref:Pentatricopeptide repeat protein n=1 Tax=Asterophora parasitica TaxID=117018 RepID=A0A9P7GDZ8_9AGAR|nr:hypothetical protein DXG03_000191 [Asterophora parasitica]